MPEKTLEERQNTAVDHCMTDLYAALKELGLPQLSVEKDRWLRHSVHMAIISPDWQP